MPTAADGDWEKWDRVWRDAAGVERLLYCAAEPLTVRQLLHRTYFEDLQHLLQPHCGARCVEVGAGRGTMSMYLARHGCDVTLVDLSDAGLATALSNFAEERLSRPHVVAADVRATGLPAEAFDCVCSTGLLEHFVDPRPVLAESLRLLRRGAVLFHIIVPETEQSRSLPLCGLLNPVGAAVRQARKHARPLFRPPRHHRSDALRTAFPRLRWRQWLRELGQPHAACIAYNPLQQIYQSPLLERTISLPLWQAYLARRKRLGRWPLLRTSDSLAQCHLLVCRKL